MSKPAHRNCLLVLGMGRSGTSALARILSLLGAALPANLMGAGVGNEAGHWEPARLVHLHDQLLAEAHSAWDDWEQLDLGKLPPQRRKFYKSEIRRVIEEEYADAPLIVLKDPRVTRFVPFYREILDDMGLKILSVLAFRNPLEVAASLAARNKMPAADAVLLWLSHTLAAERDSRDFPRVVVEYDSLLAEGSDAVARWAELLGLTWPVSLTSAAPEINASLRVELRHHSFKRAELHANPLTALSVALTYSAMQDLSRNIRDKSALGTLDRLAAEFDRATADPARTVPLLLEDELLTRVDAEAKMRGLDAQVAECTTSHTYLVSRLLNLASRMRGDRPPLSSPNGMLVHHWSQVQTERIRQS